jgi:hypothetical protein
MDALRGIWTWRSDGTGERESHGPSRVGRLIVLMEGGVNSGVDLLT